MSKKNATKNKSDRNTQSFISIDHKILPIVGMFGRSAELTYPQEFLIINSLRVNQSATFPSGKKKVVDSIRTRLLKQHGKKFTIKKVDLSNSRIWRMPDNYVSRKGGYTHGKRKQTAAGNGDKQNNN